MYLYLWPIKAEIAPSGTSEFSTTPFGTVTSALAESFTMVNVDLMVSCVFINVAYNNAAPTWNHRAHRVCSSSKIISKPAEQIQGFFISRAF